MLTPLFSDALAAIALAAGAFGLLHLALRRPVEFVALLVAVWIATVALRDALSLSVYLSDFRVSAMDVLALAMVAVGTVRFALHGVRGAYAGLCLALAALLAIHLGRGVAEFGLAAAVNSGRETLYFVAALAYAATVRGGWDKRIWKALVVAGGVTALLAIPFWLSGGLGSAGASIIRNGEVVSSRPVVAAGALLILQAAILALALRWPSRRAAIWLALGGAAALVLLQHRTLWVAGIGVAAAGFLLWSARAGRRADRTAFAVVGIALVVLPLAAWGLSRTGPLVRSAQEVTTANSTFTWRTTGWQELISNHDSPAQLVAGNPSGASLDRRINGKLITVSAHNGLVETYLRFGIPGAVAFVLLGLGLWLRRDRIAAATGLGPGAVGLLLFSQLIFALAYSLDAVQGIVIGVFVCALAEPLPGATGVAVRHRPAVPRGNLLAAPGEAPTA